MDSSTAFYTPGARKRGVVRDFYAFSPAVLQQMKNDLALFYVGRRPYFLPAAFSHLREADPTLDEIYFLDEIIKRRRPLASNTVIANVKIADANIISTTRT
jgi:hypothetical protein